MKIKFKLKDEVKFCDIEQGDSFEWDGMVLLKTDHYHGRENAVNLEDGELFRIEGMVKKLNATLLIE